MIENILTDKNLITGVLLFIFAVLVGRQVNFSKIYNKKDKPDDFKTVYPSRSIVKIRDSINNRLYGVSIGPGYVQDLINLSHEFHLHDPIVDRVLVESYGFICPDYQLMFDPVDKDFSIVDSDTYEVMCIIPSIDYED